jgi:hypothetical protein
VPAQHFNIATDVRGDARAEHAQRWLKLQVAP